MISVMLFCRHPSVRSTILPHKVYWSALFLLPGSNYLEPFLCFCPSCYFWQLFQIFLQNFPLFINFFFFPQSHCPEVRVCVCVRVCVRACVRACVHEIFVVSTYIKNLTVSSWGQCGLDTLSTYYYYYYIDNDIAMIRGVNPDIDPHVKVIVSIYTTYQVKVIVSIYTTYQVTCCISSNTWLPLPLHFPLIW